MLPNKDYVLQQLNKYTIKDEVTGCWLRQAATTNGHGMVNVGDRTCLITRLSLWAYKNFDLDGKLQANHIPECINSNCWNPDHLYAGSQSQNVADTVIVGTHRNARKTYCPVGHEFTKENTEVRGDLAKYRRCRICHNLQERLRQKRNKKK